MDGRTKCLFSKRVKVMITYSRVVSDPHSQRCMARIRFRCEIRFHSKSLFKSKLEYSFGFVKKWFQNKKLWKNRNNRIYGWILSTKLFSVPDDLADQSVCGPAAPVCLCSGIPLAFRGCVESRWISRCGKAIVIPALRKALSMVVCNSVMVTSRLSKLGR